MNINELKSFRLSDAVHFHDTLNPALWDDEHLIPQVREQLLEIAADFMEHLGVSDLDIVDIILCGSNAAYTYTRHSDIDLHLIANIEKLANDEVYRELFTAKKTVFNDSHDIKIHGFDVELYVQPSTDVVKSLGEYSILKDRWIRRPSARRSALDQTATQQKFTKLVQLCELALRSDDVADVQNLLNTIKKYRQAGLDHGGEFSPENLVYKALRSQGIIARLFAHRDELHSKKLSIESKVMEAKPQYKEIEFVCANPEFPDATDPELQRRMYSELKKIPGVIPLFQDQGEYSPGQMSLTAIYKDPNVKQFILKLAKSLGIKVDLIQPVDDRYVDRAIRGEHEGQILDELHSKKLSIESMHATESRVMETGYSPVTYFFFDYDFDPNIKKYILDNQFENSTLSCQNEANRWAKKLHKAGLDVEIHHGFYLPNHEQNDAEGHTWIEVEGSIFDPTAGQFIDRGKGEYQIHEIDELDEQMALSEASGYIPSESQRNDPRFSTALTVDVTPNSIVDNIKRLGLGPARRSGVPQTMRGSGKFKR